MLVEKLLCVSFFIFLLFFLLFWFFKARRKNELTEAHVGKMTALGGSFWFDNKLFERKCCNRLGN